MYYRADSDVALIRQSGPQGSAMFAVFARMIVSKVVVCLGGAMIVGCQAQVHPRVGHGMDPPSWQQVRIDDPATAQSQHETAVVGPMKIEARHILVAYMGATRASPSIARSRDEAFILANEVLNRAKSGDDFEGLVAEYSDEPGAATRGGRLGEFSRGQLVQPFSDAAFSLQPGQISDIVETPFGFHIIERLK